MLGSQSDGQTLAKQHHEGSRPSPRLRHMLRVDWLGQTTASICWMLSVLAYGVASLGDALQLCAAFAWLVANLATLLAVKED